MMDGVARITVPWTGRTIEGFVGIDTEGTGRRRTSIVRIGGAAIATYPGKSPETAWALFMAEYDVEHIPG
ncbi:MAG: hypothetical protein LC650_05770, partial [Actinobacteria bacterium]|nr:hypothetical protein [Actinomycetota bacterium]